MEGRALISPTAVRFRPACPEKVATLTSSVPGLSPLVGSMLVARGYGTPEEVNRFFNPSEEAFHDPFLFRGMREAVSLMREALSAGERVLVHGDYDCDGICGTTLMMEALQEIGASVGYHIPDRFEEGYGLSMQAVERCKEEGFGLLITVDCGSSSVAEVERAKEYGVKVIVTDHHTVPAEAPNPHAFINPQQPECEYPFKGICGTGVAYKLIQAFRGEQAAQPRRLLDLVALATVADVVPLVDENRVFVQMGLQELGRTERVGLTALLETAGRSGRDVVDSFTVGFTLGPRLNAAGRLEHAKLGVQLLTSRSLEESRQLAQRLDSLNEDRKECERAIQEEVEQRLQKDPEKYKCGAIVEWGENWHEGVIGITAGRLAEKYGVPTLIISVNEERAKGSGRSPENVDLYQAMKRCGHLFTKFGGHPRAGGFSLSVDNLVPLSEEMAAAANELRDGPAPVWVDGCLTLGQVDLDLVRELERMEPFGEANPKPTFLLEGVDIVHQRLVGRSGDHLQLEVEQVGQRRRAIAFRQADLVDELKTQDFRYDLRCQLGREQFRGQEQLKLQVSGVVRPPCESSPRQAPLVDLRHVRARKRALDYWLGEENRLAAVCREPEKAEGAYPDYKGQFYTYEDGPLLGEGTVLLTPPVSEEQFRQYMERVRPGRLVILFGSAEIEKLLGVCLDSRWTRQDAVALWKEIRRSKKDGVPTEAVKKLAQAKFAFGARKTERILEAFLETEALKDGGDGVLMFATANGRRLEETAGFGAWKGEREALLRVRAFFSGPDLQSRFQSHWPWLESLPGLHE